MREKIPDMKLEELMLYHVTCKRLNLFFGFIAVATLLFSMFLASALFWFVTGFVVFVLGRTAGALDIIKAELETYIEKLQR